MAKKRTAKNKTVAANPSVSPWLDRDLVINDAKKCWCELQRRVLVPLNRIAKGKGLEGIDLRFGSAEKDAIRNHSIDSLRRGIGRLVDLLEIESRNGFQDQYPLLIAIGRPFDPNPYVYQNGHMESLIHSKTGDQTTAFYERFTDSDWQAFIDRAPEQIAAAIEKFGTFSLSFSERDEKTKKKIVMARSKPSIYFRRIVLEDLAAEAKEKGAANSQKTAIATWNSDTPADRELKLIAVIRREIIAWVPTHELRAPFAAHLNLAKKTVGDDVFKNQRRDVK